MFISERKVLSFCASAEFYWRPRLSSAVPIWHILDTTHLRRRDWRGKWRQIPTLGCSWRYVVLQYWVAFVTTSLKPLRSSAVWWTFSAWYKTFPQPSSWASSAVPRASQGRLARNSAWKPGRRVAGRGYWGNGTPAVGGSTKDFPISYGEENSEEVGVGRSCTSGCSWKFYEAGG